MWFDESDFENPISIKSMSLDLKNILYNANNKTPQTTWVMFGYKTALDSTENPFISDYNPELNNGVCISHEKIKIGSKNQILESANPEADKIFPTDFSLYNYECLNNWVMYVFEVQHHTGPNLNPKNNSNLSAMLPWNNTYYSENNSVWNSPPETNNMRINVRIYYRDPNTQLVSSALLLPTINDLTNNSDTKFVIPDTIPNKCLKFFGNTPNPNVTNTDSTNWELWNGAVRNLMIFNTFLSDGQLYNLFIQSINDYYNWSDFGEYNIIKNINNNSNLGCIYTYNTKLANVLQTILKSNVTDLSNVTFINE